MAHTSLISTRDGAYEVITLAANSCLCAGCELLLPVAGLVLAANARFMIMGLVDLGYTR